MNHNTYRLVFNTARGCLIAVSESAPSRGKSGAGATTRDARRRRHRTRSSLAVSASKRPLAFTYITQEATEFIAITRVATTQTLNQTQLKGRVSFDAALKISAQIPDTQGGQELKSQINALVSQSGGSGLDYLNQLAANPNVKWDKVALAHEKWDYDQAGLTPAGAALLSIVIAAYTGGMGIEALGTSGAGAAAGTTVSTLGGATLATTTAVGVTTTTALGAAVNAGFAALSSQAAVAMVNNGGDIGKTLSQLGSAQSLKNLLTTMVAAGALQGLDKTLFGDTSSQVTSTGQAGAAAMPLATTQAASQFGNNLLKNLTNNVASSAIDAAINGRPFDEKTLASALTNALITAGMAAGANAIGDARVSSDLNAFTQNLAHAVLGCAAGAATAGNANGCSAGAVGGVVGELAAQFYNPNATPDNGQTLAFAQTMAAVAGVLAGGGGDNVQAVNIASTTGANSATNNWLGDHQKAAMSKEMAAATTGLDKLKVAAKYVVISGRQDVLTTSGVGKGLAESGWEDAKGLAAFLSDPVAGLQGIKAIITDPQTRAALGDQVFGELNAKIDRMSTALTVGGDQNAEQLGKDIGSLVWQVGSVAAGVGGAAKAGAALAKVGVDVAASTLVKTAFKLNAFEGGAIKSFKAADDVNAMMKSAEWAPAWQSGTQVAEATIKPGTTVRMVVDEKAYLDYLKSDRTNMRFGGWATFDDVPNQAYVRNQLAITPAMKGNIGYVVEIEITKPINAQVGVVGAQGTAAGGGNQLYFIIQPGDRASVFKVVGEGKLP